MYARDIKIFENCLYPLDQEWSLYLHLILIWAVKT